jgi:PAS domain S-box-containing protein
MLQNNDRKPPSKLSKELNDKRDLYRVIVEQASDAVIFADLDGIVRLWNLGAEEIFGYSAAEILGNSLDVIIPEHLRSAHWAGFRRAMGAGHTKYKRIALTTLANHKSKKSLYIDLTFNIVKGPAGGVIGAQASARDVTERYLAERALREGMMALGFISLDLDWKVTYLNHEVERILGRENVMGRNLWDEFPDLIGSLLYEKAYLALAEQNPAHFEGFFPSLNTWLEIHLYPSPAGLGIYVRNINRAKHVEEELAKSEQMLRLLVAQARDYAIIMYDTSGTIKSWNEGAERLYRYRAKEIIGRHFSQLVPEEEHSNEWPNSSFKKAIEMGNFEEEAWRARKDGSHFLANVSFTSLRDSSGQLQGFSSVTRDITERHEAEVERNRLLNEAQAAVSSRDELLSIASHEIKTPLTALSLQLQILHRVTVKKAEHDERGAISSPALKMIKSCEQQSQRLARLLDELLDVTRMRLGKLSLDLQDTDLSEITRETIERFSPDAERTGSTIKARLTPDVIGRWDSGRLEEITNNLISNAIKYGDGKPIEIQTSMDPTTKIARLVVMDHGIGIPKDMLANIFNRFERAHAEKKIKGVGLGLYIVRQLVEAHGGSIHVESEVGKSSTFTVELPLQHTPAVVPSNEGTFMQSA